MPSATRRRLGYPRRLKRFLIETAGIITMVMAIYGFSRGWWYGGIPLLFVGKELLVRPMERGWPQAGSLIGLLNGPFRRKRDP